MVEAPSDEILDRLLKEADVEALRLEEALAALTPGGGEGREAFRRALASCSGFKDLLECAAMLASRTREEETTCSRTPYRIREALEGAEGLLHLRQGFARSSVRVQCDRGLDAAEILGDPRELERVLYLLAKEAAADEELLPVRIEARLAGRGADRLMTEFRVASRVDPHPSPVSQVHTGIDSPSLALRYCRHVLARRGAELIVEEISGEGIAFRFLLDARIARAVVR